jgi:hypothetical protein
VAVGRKSASIILCALAPVLGNICGEAIARMDFKPGLPVSVDERRSPRPRTGGDEWEKILIELGQKKPAIPPRGRMAGGLLRVV